MNHKFNNERNMKNSTNDHKETTTNTVSSNRTVLLLQRGEIERFNKEVALIPRDSRILLAWTDLRNLDLRGANFKGAFLSGADLSGCDLRGVDFTDAVLYKTNFSGAHLTDARGLSGEQLFRAVGLDSATLPPGATDLDSTLPKPF